MFQRQRYRKPENLTASSKCSSANGAGTETNYPASGFAATTRHASTSARVRVGEIQRTTLIESKTTCENGSLIESANLRRAMTGIFL